MYLISPKNLIQHVTIYTARRQTFYQEEASIITGLIDDRPYGLYLLDKSNISFVFNVASKSTGDGMFHVFDSKNQLTDYQNGMAGAKAVFSRPLNIGSYNQSESTSLYLPVNEFPSYYFFAVSLPGEAYWNYSYHINAMELNHLDYKPKCQNVYESGESCSFDLPNTGTFYVLGYAEHQEDGSSGTTHLQLIINPSQAVELRITISKGLLFFGVFFFIILVSITFIYYILYRYLRQRLHKRSSSSPS